jgi:hypothetical protein
MGQPDNLGAFIEDNKDLLKEYLDTRLEIYRLQAIRLAAKTSGYLVWIIISLFLAFLIILFTGIVIGCWFSGIFHSYTLGFGLTTLLLVILFALLALMRKSLFVNPLTQAIIRITSAGPEEEEEEEIIPD